MGTVPFKGSYAKAINAINPANIATVGFLELAAPVNGGGGEVVMMLALGEKLALGNPLTVGTKGGEGVGTTGISGGLVSTGGVTGIAGVLPTGGGIGAAGVLPTGGGTGTDGEVATTGGVLSTGGGATGDTGSGGETTGGGGRDVAGMAGGTVLVVTG